MEAECTAPEIALSVVERVRALYAVEHAAKAMKPAERLALRKEKSAPIVTALRERLERWKLELLPKHPMADAVNYALNQWRPWLPSWTMLLCHLTTTYRNAK